MIVSAVARRYARAVLAAAIPARAEEQVLSDLAALDAALEANPAVRVKLRSPVLGLRRKAELVRAAVAAWNPSPVVARLLTTLADNGRAHLIREVLSAFRQELDRHRGIVEAQVATPAPLDPDSRKRLERSLGKLTGKTVRLVERTDPALLAGVVARIGSVVYDASVLARIERIRGALAGE